MANLKNILFSALLLCGLASCRNTDENAGSPVTGYDTEVSAECLSSLISDFECLQLYGAQNEAVVEVDGQIW